MVGYKTVVTGSDLVSKKSRGAKIKLTGAHRRLLKKSRRGKMVEPIGFT